LFIWFGGVRLAVATPPTGCSYTSDWLQPQYGLAAATPPTGYSHTTDWLQPHHRLATATPPTGCSHTTEATTTMFYLIILITITLASSNNRLVDVGD